MAEVDAVNAGEVRERVNAAQMQDDNALRLGILFVVGKAGFDQQLLTDKPRWRVATFADLAGRSQVADGRGNRLRITIESDFNELLGTVYLGLKIGLLLRSLYGTRRRRRESARKPCTLCTPGA